MTTSNSSSIKQTLIALACKVIVFLSLLLNVPWLFSNVVSVASSGLDGDIVQVTLASSVLSILAILVICVLLWRGADGIGTCLISEDANNGVIDVTFATAALSLFGVVLVVLNIGPFVNALGQAFLDLYLIPGGDHSALSIITYSLSAATPMIQMAIGAWFFWQAHKLAPFIDRMSTKGIFQRE